MPFWLSYELSVSAVYYSLESAGQVCWRANRYYCASLLLARSAGTPSITTSRGYPCRSLLLVTTVRKIGWSANHYCQSLLLARSAGAPSYSLLLAPESTRQGSVRVHLALLIYSNVSLMDLCCGLMSVTNYFRSELDKESTDLVDKVIHYCVYKRYPAGATKNEKRIIRRKAERFEVSDSGELFYLKRSGQKVSVFIFIFKSLMLCS